MMTKEERAARKAERNAEKRAEKLAIITRPGKLSKMGEWMRQHPGGVGGIIDMRAVMK